MSPASHCRSVGGLQTSRREYGSGSSHCRGHCGRLHGFFFISPLDQMCNYQNQRSVNYKAKTLREIFISLPSVKGQPLELGSPEEHSAAVPSPSHHPTAHCPIACCPTIPPPAVPLPSHHPTTRCPTIPLPSHHLSTCHPSSRRRRGDMQLGRQGVGDLVTSPLSRSAPPPLIFVQAL